MKPLLGSSPIRPYVCPSCIKILRLRRRSFATETQKYPEVFDVVCVGGGPAGLSLLTALRSSPITSSLNLALIESQDLNPSRKWDPPPNQFSNRTSSLTPASQSFLSKIGAWPHIDHSRTQPYHQMQVWDGMTSSRIAFDWSSAQSQASSSPTKTVATMTENPNLTRALLNRLSSLPPISIFSPTKLNSISPGPSPTSPTSPNLFSYPHLTLSSQSSPVVARLLIGADGLNSPVRAFAGISSRGWDYNRFGVVATVKLSGFGWGRAGEKIAYQRFLPTGPVALLALPGEYATLVWSTLPQHAARLKSLSKVNFAAMVDAAFRLSAVDIEYLLTLEGGQAEEVRWREKHTAFEEDKIPQKVASVQEESIASFPLHLRHADTYISERVALVGDAAHTIHPLAGQGLNQGQGDVAALVKAIEYAVTHGWDIGREMSLEGYNAERWAVNNRLLGIVDKLHKLYSVQSGPLVGLRSWGLGVVNGVAPLKEFFMKQAERGGF